MVLAEVKGIDEYNKAVDNLIQTLGLNYQEVYQQEARLLGTEFMKRTPPFPGGNAAGSNEKDAQISGDRTIKHDMINSITPSDEAFDEETRNERIRKVIRKKDVAALKKMFEKMPAMSGWNVIPFDIQKHKQIRGSAGRRYEVKKSYKNLTLENAQHKRAVKSEQKKPGWMKSGWGIGVSMLQGRVPAWISRHFGSAPGGMEMNLADDNPTPWIKIWNNAPTIDRYAASMEYAVKERLRTIGVKLQQALERRLKQNFKQK